MALQPLRQGYRQHRDSISATFAISDHDVRISEIDIFHAQAHTLHEAQAAAVKQLGHQSMRSVEVAENSLHFLSCQHYWNAPWPARSLNRSEPADLLFEHFFIEKEQRAESLILG